MKHVKRYLFSAALIICLLYNVIFTPSNTKEQRTINVVTEKVEAVKYCDKYLVHFILNVSATFCVKDPSEDQVVSRDIASGGWEVEEVSKVLEAMTLHPGAVFLDIGSNIGAYTVPVAAMGRSVVAVDMMLDNLAYIRTSLESMDRPGHVELVHNAVSNSHEVFQPIENDAYIAGANPGSNKAVPLTQMKSGDKVMGQVVDSVTVGDLLSLTLSSTYIIKTDIEDFDCEVIDPNVLQSTGHYIPYIFMEWNGESETCWDLASSLLSSGYTPWLSDAPDVSIHLTGVCLHGGCVAGDSGHSNMAVMWIHPSEKIIWPKKKGECYCESQEMFTFIRF